MEVFLLYLDELDDAWFSVAFILSRPLPRLAAIVTGATLLGSCGVATP